ncbi:MAG: SBBP repeat-containing protein [Acidobacteria bacterium]|nr:SBBP repeat-containing protein [Acidobacteriota bacterium]
MIALLCVTWLPGQGQTQASQMPSLKPSSVPTSAVLNALPLTFETNQGQFSSDVKFRTRIGQANALLTSSGLVLQQPNNDPSSQTISALRFIGGAIHPEMIGEHPQTSRSNYLFGSKESQWKRDIPHFGKVRYRRVYPGIDVVVYGNPNQLEYDFMVAPGGQTDSIVLGFEGIDLLSLDQTGNLIVTGNSTTTVHHKPVAYQMIGGQKRLVDAQYQLDFPQPPARLLQPDFFSPTSSARLLQPSGSSPKRVRFKLGTYDPTQPLVIDPTVSFSSFLGGGFPDAAFAVAADGLGNVVVVGTTLSINFLTQFPLQPENAGEADIIVAKIDTVSGQLVFSTYFGGNRFDEARGVAIDREGGIYIAGRTTSLVFPTTDQAFQKENKGNSEGFVVKLNSGGSAVEFATLLGGAGRDEIRGMALDAQGNPYVTGFTLSTDFPVKNAFQPRDGGDSFTDAFVTKLNRTGSELIYSTYLGGNEDDLGADIAVDQKDGSAVVTGYLNSKNFPLKNPTQTTFSGGLYDVFVTKFSPAGDALVFSTYLGATDQERGAAAGVDEFGDVYVTGFTGSPDFPTTANALQKDLRGVSDIFVTKYSPTGGRIFSTFFGGAKDEQPFDMAIDARNTIYLVGVTTSPDYPLTNPIRTEPGNVDSFVTRLSRTGDRAIYSTYFGGAQVDNIFGVAADADGNVYVCGQTTSDDLPLVHPVQMTRAGVGDAFISKLSDPADFSLNIAVSAITLQRGKKTRLELTINRFGGYDDLVTVTGPSVKEFGLKLKPGVIITPESQAVFTLKAKATAQRVTRILTFTATDNFGRTRTLPITVTIQ